MGGNGNVPLTVLLMATTEANPGLKNALDSLSINGYDYRVLGLGSAWRGWRMRMEMYRDAASTKFKEDERSIVVCMDAYDAVAIRPLKQKGRSDLVETFTAFNKPLVLSLESECGTNCVSLHDYWKTDGIFYLENCGYKRNGPKPTHRFVNGGLLMGYAWAIRDMFDWILNTKTQDDQKGIARYALAHRNMWAPDLAEKIFKNRVFGTKLSPQDLQFNGVFFAHFPGMISWSAAGYDEAVETVLKRPSNVKSKNHGSLIRYSLTIVAIVLSSILAAIVCIFLLKRSTNITPTKIITTPPTLNSNPSLPITTNQV